MTTIREFCCIDLLRLASVNLDHFVYTETMTFYLGYLGKWPDYMKVAVAPCNRIIGYIIGEADSGEKSSKQGTYWTALITAVTVASEYRRQKCATDLVKLFEENHDNSHNAYYNNLFVRVTNTLAVKMFAKLGYICFKRVPGLYTDNEDAFEMRKFYSKLSVKDEYGGVRLGVYSVDDNLNFYPNPLFIWGGERKAERIFHQRFHIVDDEEFLRIYGATIFYGQEP